MCLKNNKKMIKSIKREFLLGIIRGIGTGVGFSFVSAIVIYIFQKIIKLNIPLISKYLKDIIEILNKY